MCAISPNAYSKDMSVSVCTCPDACSDDKSLCVCTAFVVAFHASNHNISLYVFTIL